MPPETLSLSPELCGKIADFSAHRRPDLLALSLTCKAFQREAEPRLYAHIVLADTQRTLAVCRALCSSDRGRSLALHVRAFGFTQTKERPARPRVPAPTEIESHNLGRAFWGPVQAALVAMHNLEILLLSDLSAANSWVLEHPRIAFRLRELKVRFAWDAPLARFLATRGARQLKALHVYDSMDLDADTDFSAEPDPDVVLDLPPGALPELRLFDGTLSHMLYILDIAPAAPGAPCLTHIQLSVDLNPPDILSALGAFSRLGPISVSPSPSSSLPPHPLPLPQSLRALSILDIPADLVLPALTLLCPVLPSLRHLGLLPYPIPSTARPLVLAQLMRLPHLTHLELDLSRWAASGPGWGLVPGSGLGMGVGTGAGAFTPFPSILPSLLPAQHGHGYPQGNAHPHALIPPPPSQRALAAEIRTFCPGVRVVVFWMGNVRVSWAWQSHTQGVGMEGGNGQEMGMMDGFGHGYAGQGAWQSRVEQGVYPQYSNAWSLV